MFSLPPEAPTPGIFSLEAQEPQGEELETELQFWSREQRDAFHKAVGAGLHRWPWLAARRIPGKSPLEVLRLVSLLQRGSEDVGPLNGYHSTILVFFCKRPWRKEACEMPSYWTGTTEEKFIPSDPKTAASSDALQRSARALFEEENVNMRLRKAGVGKETQYHPDLIANYYQVVRSYVKQVAERALVIASDRKRNRGYSQSDDAENKRKGRVTANDVREACILVLNEEPPEFTKRSKKDKKDAPSKDAES